MRVNIILLHITIYIIYNMYSMHELGFAIPRQSYIRHRAKYNTVYYLTAYISEAMAKTTFNRKGVSAVRSLPTK